jgi:hypothetical protein
MADRDLRVPDFIKLYEAHGCEVYLTRKNFVIVNRHVNSGPPRRFSQHAHKGRKDIFRRRIVRFSRKRLGFDDMPDAEFYAPLD